MSEESYTTGTSFSDLPSSGGDSVYPYNKVRKTVSGHQFEEDDTWNNERLKRMHCSGTSEEIHPDGTRDWRVMGDDYEVIVKDKKLIVSGNLTITVINGPCNIIANQDLNINCNGNLDMTVGGNRHTRIAGNDILEVDGDICTRAGKSDKHVGEAGTGNIKMQCYNYEEKVKGTFNSTVNKKAQVTWNWGPSDGDPSWVEPDVQNKNIFHVANNLYTFVGKQNLIQSGEFDLRTCGGIYPESISNDDGIKFTSGTGITVSTAPGDLINVEQGNMNFVTGTLLTMEVGDVIAASSVRPISLIKHRHEKASGPSPSGKPIP